MANSFYSENFMSIRIILRTLYTKIVFLQNTELEVNKVEWRSNGIAIMRKILY